MPDITHVLGVFGGTEIFNAAKTNHLVSQLLERANVSNIEDCLSLSEAISKLRKRVTPEVITPLVDTFLSLATG